MSALPAGRHFFRNDDGYEAARRGTVWHQRVPERYPGGDRAGRRYRRHHRGSSLRQGQRLKVSIVSGGHSFAASHLRDGSVLLDVSRLDHAEIDAEKGRRRRRSGQGRQPADGRPAGAQPVLPRRPLQGRLPRWLSVAGRIRLEQPDLRPGLRECHRSGRHHRRRRADPLRRRQSRRSLLGRPRRRPGLFRRCDVVSPQAVPAARRLWHQRVPLPVRPGRGGLHVGSRRRRRSRPAGRAAGRRLPR